MISKRYLVGCTLMGLLLVGCQTKKNGTATGTPSSVPTVSANALFVDKAPSSGVHFTHESGATGKFWYIENTPPGCAFLDFDKDGWLDIVLVQSGSSEPFAEVKSRPSCALYRNNRDGSFTDVTAGSGLDSDLGYGQGVAIGDYDNDGFADILVTAYDTCHLFHNEQGCGKFTDVSRPMGLGELHGYFTSAAFGDYDNDSRLDLYICRYGPWDWKKNVPCRDSLGPDYCPPIIYEPDHHLLLHNEGTRFRDVSQPSGILGAKGRGLGVVFLDFNGDGKPDIFVANDQTPNMLWENVGKGVFREVGLATGCAYDASGQVMAGMGVAVGDYDHSGNQSLFVGNFSDKPNMLFKNSGAGVFEDVSYASGLALPHMKFLTFGAEFLDYDADGWLDVLTVNGHVKVSVDRQSEGISYKQRKQLFRNDRNGRFTEITDADALGDLATPTLGRGLAVGDYDNDGRLDALVSNQGEPAQLFHNQTRTNGNHWIAFLPTGTRSNRDGRLARFRLTAGGATQTAVVNAGSSYLSASDLRTYFGLGKTAKVDQVEIQWPAGTRDRLTDLQPDMIYLVTEGKGITGTIGRQEKR